MASHFKRFEHIQMQRIKTNERIACCVTFRLVLKYTFDLRIEWFCIQFYHNQHLFNVLIAFQILFESLIALDFELN